MFHSPGGCAPSIFRRPGRRRIRKAFCLGPTAPRGSGGPFPTMVGVTRGERSADTWHGAGGQKNPRVKPTAGQVLPFQEQKEGRPASAADVAGKSTRPRRPTMSDPPGEHYSPDHPGHLSVNASSAARAGCLSSRENLVSGKSANPGRHRRPEPRLAQRARWYRCRADEGDQPDLKLLIVRLWTRPCWRCRQAWGWAIPGGAGRRP